MYLKIQYLYSCYVGKICFLNYVFSFVVNLGHLTRSLQGLTHV